MVPVSFSVDRARWAACIFALFWLLRNRVFLLFGTLVTGTVVTQLCSNAHASVRLLHMQYLGHLWIQIVVPSDAMALPIVRIRRAHFGIH